MNPPIRAVIVWLMMTGLLFNLASYFLNHRGQPTMTAAYLLAAATLAALAGNLNQIRSVVRDNALVVGIAAVLFAYLTLHHYVTAPGGEAHKQLGKSVTLLLYVIACGYSFSQPRMRLLVLGTLIVSATLAATLSIYLDCALPDYRPLIDNRLYAIGTLSNPVESGLSFSWVAMLIICIACTDQRYRWVTLLALPLLIATYRTGSVGAAIALFTAFMALGATWLPNRLKIGALLMGVTTLVTVIAVLFTGHAEPLMAELPRGTSFRPEIWNAALHRAMEHSWLFGLGPGDSGDLHLSFHFQHPHSLFIATFYYGGAIALMLLLALLVVTIRQTLNLPVHGQRLLLPLQCFALTALSLDGDRIVGNMSFVWLLVWLPVGLLIAMRSSPTGLTLR